MQAIKQLRFDTVYGIDTGIVYDTVYILLYTNMLFVTG